MEQACGREIKLKSGDYLRVEPLSSGIIRVRMRADQRFSPSTTERYGVVRSSWDRVPYQVSENNDRIDITMEGLMLSFSSLTGELCLKDSAGDPLVDEIKPFFTGENKGVGAAFSLEENERFYGLGYRKTDYIQLRGRILRNHVSYGECYGPSPFLMSSRGWGIYFNTTFDSYFDIGHNQSDQMHIWSAKGECDFYLMTGDMRKLLDQYTNITGKPALMPLWGYGLMFICNEKENQFDVLNNARTFRQEEIPCDMIGLEPGWMSEHYDLSVKKDWNRDRFYMPWWSEDRKAFKDVTFIGALERNGFNLSLWLCCDYDLFEEEERQAALNGFPIEIGEDNQVLPFGFGKLDFDPRAHAPVHMDKVTVKNEPWFEHLKKFVDNGIAAFKQDPAFIVNDHPDRRYVNGMLDDEAHNIWTTVLAKQVHKGYRDYTGKRPMHFMGTAYTGIQKWAPTWTCDCGGREEALMGLLHYSMVGHMNTTCDMDVYTLEGIHFGFLQPWSQVNSWAYIAHPWWLGSELMETFKYYAELHYALLPYIYACAHVGAQTGMPIVRPMPLMYPDDPRVWELNRQYMLGDWLLVTAFCNRVVLPEGRWIDYFTGESYMGPVEMNHEVPPGRGGCLFIKAGAILPYWRHLKCAPQKPVDGVDVHLYPDGTTRCVLYEDDGITFAYEDGVYAETEICCSKTVDGVEIAIVPIKRDFADRPDPFHYRLKIYDKRPEVLQVNHIPLESNRWAYDEKEGVVKLDVMESECSRTVITYCYKEKYK